MKISEVMTRSVESITPEQSLQQAAARMRDLDVGSLPVVDRDGRVVALRTYTDAWLYRTAGPSTADAVVAAERETHDGCQFLHCRQNGR